VESFLITWSNKQVSRAFVAKKLDRILANEVWLSLHWRNLVEFVKGGVSDQSYAIVSIVRWRAVARSLLIFLASRLKVLVSWIGLGRDGGWGKMVIQCIGYILGLKQWRGLWKNMILILLVTSSIYKVFQAHMRLQQAQQEVIASGVDAACILKENETLHELDNPSRWPE
jgi:hypothetical protein